MSCWRPHKNKVIISFLGKAFLGLTLKFDTDSFHEMLWCFPPLFMISHCSLVICPYFQHTQVEEALMLRYCMKVWNPSSITVSHAVMSQTSSLFTFKAHFKWKQLIFETGNGIVYLKKKAVKVSHWLLEIISMMSGQNSLGNEQNIHLNVTFSNIQWFSLAFLKKRRDKSE